MKLDDDRTEIYIRPSEPEVIQVAEPAKPDRAYGYVVGYKLARSGLSLLLALTLAALLLLGGADPLARAAMLIRHHFSSSFAGSLSDQLMRAWVPSRLWLVVGALTVDGLITGVEGYALRAGKTWGTWLVVIATTALVPFELVSLVRAPHVGRAILLLLNIAVAVYLLRRAMRDGTRPVTLENF
jgi:uncharacterized membrane protein (DUF2068 family)